MYIMQYHHAVFVYSHQEKYYLENIGSHNIINKSQT